MPVAVPPADEQAAIVKYLGHAHARIDRAIAAKRKLIALLEEQRAATIEKETRSWLVGRAFRSRRWFAIKEGPGIMAADFRDAECH